MGEEGAKAVEELLKSASRPGSSLLASIVGVATSPSSVPRRSSPSYRVRSIVSGARLLLQQSFGVLALLRARLLSFGMVIAMGFLLLVSLVIGAALSALDKWSGAMIPGSAVLLSLLNIAFGFVVTTLLFAMAYRILPRVKVAWADVWIGATVTAVLFTIGKYLIGLYLGGGRGSARDSAPPGRW